MEVLFPLSWHNTGKRGSYSNTISTGLKHCLNIFRASNSSHSEDYRIISDSLSYFFDTLKRGAIHPLSRSSAFTSKLVIEDRSTRVRLCVKLRTNCVDSGNSICSSFYNSLCDSPDIRDIGSKLHDKKCFSIWKRINYCLHIGRSYRSIASDRSAKACSCMRTGEIELKHITIGIKCFYKCYEILRVGCRERYIEKRPHTIPPDFPYLWKHNIHSWVSESDRIPEIPKRWRADYRLPVSRIRCYLEALCRYDIHTRDFLIKELYQLLLGGCDTGYSCKYRFLSEMVLSEFAYIHQMEASAKSEWIDAIT